jgi:predicted phage terminase large subunit-like protein
VISAADAAAELLARRKARESFPGFCEWKLRDTEFKMALHHRVIAEALDDVERGKCDRLMLMLPPGSAKSTYASVFFPEYFLGRNPQLQVISASHTVELAEAFGRRVRNAVEESGFKTMWNVGLAGDNAAAGRWATDKGGQYFAVGVGGSVTGRRGDLICIDDPVASREDADSERVREKTWEWWTNDLLTRLKPGGRIVFVMTRWHENDLAGRILDREGDRWKVIKIPMIAGERDVLGRKPGEMLWPEWFTEDMLAQAQSDPRSWMSLYQQEPRPADGAEFKRSWLQRYSTPPNQLNKVILVDPAGAKGKNSDYTSMWVVGLGADENAYVIDGLRDRLNLTERANALFELHRKHKPMQVRYERYGAFGDIEHIKSEMERRQYRFAIQEVGGQVQKEARIRRLVPWFEGGRIWLPHEMMRTNVEGKTYDVIKDFVEQEYAAFPVARHDDALDCLARLAEPKLALPWPREEEDYADARAAAAWGVLDDITAY